jgi:hypothetical protein
MTDSARGRQVMRGARAEVVGRLRECSGCHAGDGSSVLPTRLPRALAEIMAQVVPVLRRGLFRGDHTGSPTV